MGRSTPLIRTVATPAYGRVVIEASDGNRYSSDLSSFHKVWCYPADADAWSRVSVDSYGLALVWACRFEAHVDQIVALADKIEPVDAAA